MSTENKGFILLYLYSEILEIKLSAKPFHTNENQRSQISNTETQIKTQDKKHNNDKSNLITRGYRLATIIHIIIGRLN